MLKSGLRNLPLLWLFILSPAVASPETACASPLTSSIANSCIVTANTLWRGAKPDAAGAAALLEKGVKSVVNLELLHDDRNAFNTAQPALSGVTTVDYYRIREWEPNVIIAQWLLDRHVADFIRIMRQAAKPVYVHCRAGQNRTGVMVAAYRMLVENMPVEQAINEMQQYQGVWFKQDAAYLRELDSNRREIVEKLIRENADPVLPLARLTCSKHGCETDK